jgi:acetoin utilization protein AcuB
MLVKDWMAPDPICVDPNTPLLEAKYLVGERRIRHLPVVVSGVLVGILSDRDLREFAPSRASAVDTNRGYIEIDDMRVEEVMSRHPITIGPEETIEHAAQLMAIEKIGALPVVEADDRVIGIITETDLFKALIFLAGALPAGLRV